MQENFEIVGVSRDDQGKGASRRLRREGMVPGIVYGGGKDPSAFATKHSDLLHHLEHEAFYSHILTLKVGDSAEKVVLKDLQRHPSKPFVIHLDLLRVADSDRIKMHVPLHFINEQTAPGVKAGGQLSHVVTDVEIICAAKDLPEFIEVNVGALEVGQAIHLSDLQLPNGVTLVAFSRGDVEGQDRAVVAIHASRGGAEAEEGEGEEEEG